MKRLIYLHCAVLILTLFQPTSCLGSFQSIHMKAVKCNTTEKFMYLNYTCFAKAYSRSVSTVTVIGTTRYPLDNFYATAQMYFKYGTIYREVMTTPKIFWCQMMKSKKDSDNKMIAALVQVFKDSYPEMIHECPYTFLNARNLSVNIESMQNMIMLFPTGDYKVIYKMFMENDEFVGAINMIASVNSTIKETFG